jgi:GntR family transcriptional regulator of arabinose operon
VAFLGMPNAAATVDAREAGYREALFVSDLAGTDVDRGLILRLDPADAQAIDAFMTAARPDAIVCANDRTAGVLMRTLLRLGHAIPQDVRLVGIDDAGFAALLPVPLTTLRQPTREIGDAALAAMLQRVARKDLPVRDILLDCRLVVRESCGAGSSQDAP